MIPLLLCPESGGFTFGSHLPRQAEHFVRDTHEYGQTQHNQQQDGAHSHDRLAIGGGGRNQVVSGFWSTLGGAISLLEKAIFQWGLSELPKLTGGTSGVAGQIPPQGSEKYSGIS